MTEFERAVLEKLEKLDALDKTLDIVATQVSTLVTDVKDLKAGQERIEEKVQRIEIKLEQDIEPKLQLYSTTTHSTPRISKLFVRT